MNKKLSTQLLELANSKIGTKRVRNEFLKRLKTTSLTRDEGELTHFGVFVMAIDLKQKMVFIGHHKKSDKWLPQGGHIDKGELVEETALREIKEEWGVEMGEKEIGGPVLLTTTNIDKKELWKVCKKHYDVWYFVVVDKNKFFADPELLSKEFYETDWFNLDSARKLCSDNVAVQNALDLVAIKYFTNYGQRKNSL